ncbi:ABC-type oligopeptide transport system substrate-binding subunit [Ewingella americana]
MFSRLITAALFSALSLCAQAEVIQDSYAFSVLGEPKYFSNFSNFDYVNPAAPKGGTIRLAAIGTYDNFNRYASARQPGGAQRHPLRQPVYHLQR